LPRSAPWPDTAGSDSIMRTAAFFQNGRRRRRPFANPISEEHTRMKYLHWTVDAAHDSVIMVTLSRQANVLLD
jgi:hypothetical protein